MVDIYAAQTAAVRDRVVGIVDQVWVGMDNWRDDDIDRFATLVAPVVEAGQLQTAAMTDAYLASLERAMFGGAVRPVGIPREAAVALRGIKTVDVYRRAGPQVWTALSRGQALDQAVAGARTRMQVTAATDLQLSSTHATRYALRSNNRVVGYRRILTGSRSCRLCVTASTQRYRKGELMPIHGRCGCRTAPIYGDADPGQVINSDLLADLKGLDTDAAGARNGQRAARESTMIVHEHNEIGPVLGDAAHHFADLG